MMKHVLGWFVVIVSGICVLPIFASEAKDPFVLIPKAKTESYGQDVDKLTNPNTPEGKKFWNAYNTTAKKYLEKDESGKEKLTCDLGAMLSSGIVTWDTILCLLIRVVRFIANMALVVGSAMIIYAGYLYTVSALSATSVDKTSEANDAVKNAAIGIVIVVFSYAIQRIVTQAFLS